MRNIFNALEGAGKKKDFTAIKVMLAPPEKIREWSYGEVRAPETINYRTFTPERGGLFCAKIFGPTKDYECLCGKYKRMKFRGVVCEKCGVEVTLARVRRERMGHINLACPVAHILFFKALPSRIGLVLDLTMRDIERILYFEAHVVTRVKWDNMRGAVYNLARKLQPLLGELARSAKIDEQTVGKFEHELARADNFVHWPAHGAKLLQKFAVAAAERGEEFSAARALLHEFRQLMELEPGRMLSVTEHSELADKYPNIFESGIGAEGVRNFLKNINLKDESLKLRFDNIFKLPKRTVELIFSKLAHLVVDSKIVGSKSAPGLKREDILDTDEAEEWGGKHPGKFTTVCGADEVREFMRTEKAGERTSAVSDTRYKKIFKRLKIIENFDRAGLRPEWMVLEALPVLPPDLRPLVQLEGGRFTTSDLNDLYRRVINRNNRLKRLMDLGAPEVIINNEKRMLQESVDSLLDNGRRGKPATGANRRPLKSMADVIKGKSGRFRQNLLGKRVDFSGRSVIIVGPDLKLHQCGLPKQMALTLFRPFVFNKLMKEGYASSFKSARAMVEAEDPQVWGVLEEVIAQHPVLLNRAPTLHRLGVQAFEPVLTEGKAIQLHPLVCVAFNADFDGDQMAVHVPLSLEAQAEARVLMLSSNNILHPAHGEPIIVPTQDVVLGLYYATREIADAPGKGMVFSDIAEVERALAAGAVKLQTPIEVRVEHDLAALTDGEYPDGEDNMRLVKTTAGRALLKRFLPEGLPFSAINKTIKKRELTKLVKESFWRCGHRATVIFCDQLMRFGFEKATRAGISVCMEDMIIPPEKTGIIKDTEAKIQETHRQFQNGLLTEDERYNKSVDLWDKAGEEVSRVMMKSISLEKSEDAATPPRESFNSIYMMADSGARGSETQIKQLAGMRGLMTKPDGRIMENAITANFREGLSVLQYFISTHGARKGLSDTALKTANSGYLTRRLVDVTQDIVISEMDCGSTDGIMLRPVIKDGNEQVSLADRMAGRTLAAAVKHPQSGNTAYPAGTFITEKEAHEIAEELGIDEVKVRSPVTCKTNFGLCVKCYGRDLGRGGKVCLGEAVGVVAAQSIGEPGTQLTMRTFHIGGAASREVVVDNINARNGGKFRLHGARYVTNSENELVIVSRGGEMSVEESSGRERERYRLQYGQVLKFKDGDEVKPGQSLSLRDPMARPIIAEYKGEAKLENIELGVNAREQTDETTGLSVMIITENKQGSKKAKQPQMKFTGANGVDVKIRGTETPVTIDLLPGTILSPKVRSRNKIDGGKISIGDTVAKIPQKTKSRDITGGLPRVAELFEAREPKESAILANSSGRVALRGLMRTKQVLAIVDDNTKKTNTISPDYKLLVKDNSEVKRGDIIAENGEGDKIVAKLSGLLFIHTADSAKKEDSAEGPLNQVRELCKPEKAPPHLKEWAEQLTEQLKEFSGGNEKLRRIVGKAETELGKIASRRQQGVSNKKFGEWLRQFRRRAADNVKRLPELKQWAEDTSAKLDGADKLKQEGKLSYGYLREIAAAAENGLSAHAFGENEQMLISWRKRKDEIDADARAMLAPLAARDEKAAQQADDMLAKLKIIAGNMRKRKISGVGKDVEIVAAKFHNVPKGRAILVQDGSFISKGEEIVDGDSNPHEILAMRGVEALVEHIVNEVQDVYRLQGVNINDKHIEVIVHQMMRCARITDPGDSHLIPGDHIMRTALLKTNAALEEAGKRTAKSRVILMGITKASLATDSFISAASFQETSRVLTEAAVAGQRDFLRGLKENVIVGRLVPTGTGFVHYQKAKERNAEMEAQQLLRDQLEASGEEEIVLPAAGDEEIILPGDEEEIVLPADEEESPPPPSAAADG